MRLSVIVRLFLWIELCVSFLGFFVGLRRWVGSWGFGMGFVGAFCFDVCLCQVSCRTFQDLFL